MLQRRRRVLGVALAALFAATSAAGVTRADEPAPRQAAPAPIAAAQPATSPAAAVYAPAGGAQPGAPAFSYGTPAPSGPAATPHPRRSTAMMVTGIVLAGLGAVSVVYGGAVVASDGHDCLLLTAGGDCQGQSQDAAGKVMIISGAVLVASGIPLIVVGGSRVDEGPAEEKPAVAASLLVGGRSAALRLTF